MSPSARAAWSRSTTTATQLHAHVNELTELHEAAFPEPWQVTDAPADYLERQLKGIVGFRITIEALEGKKKLSQNRSEADRDERRRCRCRRRKIRTRMTVGVDDAGRQQELSLSV